MPGSRRAICFALLVLFSAVSAFAQFTSSVQGTVQDPSGAGIAKATVRLVNVATKAAQTTTSDAAGNFRFLSLAPGSYKVTVEASGFAKSEVDITLLTEQNLSVPVTLKVGSISETVMVTTEAPVVDTADSRTQLTLENQAVAQLAHCWPKPGNAGDDGARSFGPGNKRRGQSGIRRGQLFYRRAGRCQRKWSGRE